MTFVLNLRNVPVFTYVRSGGLGHASKSAQGGKNNMGGCKIRGSILIITVLSTFLLSLGRYTWANDLPPYTASVELDGKTYFIHKNSVHWKFDNSDQTFKVPDSDDQIDSLVVYQDHLYALTGAKRPWIEGVIGLDRGTVYELNNNSWTPIGYLDKQVLATKSDLVTLGFNGQLWIYNGAVAQPSSTTIIMPMKIGNTTTYIPETVTNQPSSFHATGLTNVKSISVQKTPNGAPTILVTMSDGNTMTLDELKAANFSEQAALVLNQLQSTSSLDSRVYTGNRNGQVTPQVEAPVLARTPSSGPLQ